MKRKRRSDPVEEMMAIFDDMLEEAKESLFNEENLAVVLVGGVASFIAGVALGAPAFAVMGSATLLAYLGKSFLEFAYDTPAEKALRRQKVTLREIDAELDRLEEELTEVYRKSRYYRGEEPGYTMEEFKQRRRQLHEVFAAARGVQTILLSGNFGKTAWDTIIPEIQKLVKIAVLLYQKRLFLLGQLIGISVGGSQEFERLTREVSLREQELRQRGMDEELRQRRQDAYEAAQRQLRGYQEGLGSPEALVSTIDKVEADFDTVRITLGHWLIRLRGQAAQATSGISTGELEELRQELVATVQSLTFTQEAQEEMGEILRGEVRAGLTRMQGWQDHRDRG